MKCPKCAYLGFEEVDRCRNCGYDFSLLANRNVPDFAIRPDAASPTPLDDLVLIDAATEPPPAVPMTDAGPEFASFESPDRIAARPSDTNGDLPLFRANTPDDEPLIRKPLAPRPPLSVRRATPDPTRLRTDGTRPQSLELSMDIDNAAARLAPSYTPAARASNDIWPEPRSERAETATAGVRLVAAAIDLAILAAVDAIVIYFTMQICGISWTDAGLLPRGPLLAFLIVQNGGYFVAFTAGGQTLGKMAAGIRIVGTESAGALDLGRAFTRTAIWFVLAIPAGLGFLTLLGRDHRGLHDRFAGTRVVRASA